MYECIAYSRSAHHRVNDESPPAGNRACQSALGGLPFFASQGMGPIAAETSIMSSFLNDASCGRVTRINKSIRTAHEVPMSPMTYRSLSDPVFVTFPRCRLGRAEGRQVSSRIQLGDGRARDFQGSALTDLPEYDGLEEMSSGHTVELWDARCRVETWRTRKPRSPGDEERLDSVEEQHGGSGCTKSSPGGRCSGQRAEHVAAREMLATGCQSASPGKPSRWLDFPAREHWRLIRNPTFESARQRFWKQGRETSWMTVL